jgi:phosphoribosylanthranilate isomerase
MSTWVKICGVTNVEEAVRVAELGADAIGLNFYAKSPRFIDTDRAKQIIDSISTLTIGVTVEPDEELIAKILQTGAGGLQTYSDKPIRSITSKHIPAYRVKDRESLERIRTDIASFARPPMAVLVDSYVPGEMGGTGQAAPWELLRGFDPGVPLILAGGLTPDNVAEAIRIVKPWGVDVASGVESSPGRKDLAKVRDFIQAARS